MSQAPVLAYPTSEDAFVLDTDASNTGIGAVLSQKQEGEERVIAYFSRCLTRSEWQYCVTRKELLALVTAVRHFHHYVCGRHFKVRTDHGALRWLMNFKNPEGKQRGGSRRSAYMTWKLSTAKGEITEMRTDFPDVPVTIVDIASAVR